MKISNLREDAHKIVKNLREKHEFYFYNDKITDENVRSNCIA
jgi:predicted RNA-binding protein (virulence factor B family)